ncbi:PLC-like phosphodiesterase [Infundibulicybe gibba]|nr:PLC-like phosphodiesterase [Infundibulicybe gibba]
MLLSPKHLAQVVLSVSLYSLTLVNAAALNPARAGPVRRATVCNGHAELCTRSYGNVSFVGAHDSYAIGVNNLAVNQDQSITQQLNDGIRMLQMQAHNNNGAIQLCHTSCSLFNGGTLEDTLKTVKSWLDSNPNEGVLSLLIVNSDNLPVSQYDTVFKSASVDTISFVPPKTPLTTSEWPTLGSMIDSGKRLVTFLDNGANAAAVPYLIDEFTNVWETAFNVIDPAAFDCSLLFGQPVPDIAQANVTNGVSGAGSLGQHVNTCVAQNTRPPNFLLVDFYEFGGGSVFQVAATINGVTYSQQAPLLNLARPRLLRHRVQQMARHQIYS